MLQRINSIASLFLIVLFLLPDGVRSAQAWGQFAQSFDEPLRYSGTLSLVPEKQPSPISGQPEPVITKHSPANNAVQTFTAIEEVAYLGNHPSDPMNQAANDVFRVEVKGLTQEKYATLSYEVNGLANGLNLPKSINGAPSYVGAKLEVGEDWQKVEQAVPVSQLNEGINLIRFHTPHLFPSWVEVKNVQIQLSDESIKSLTLTQIVRQAAQEESFTAKLDETALTSYRVEDIDMPAIPRNIVNVTRDGWGYLVAGNRDQVVQIKLGVDRAKVPAGTGIEEVQIFYFDHSSHTWQITPSENIAMDKADMEGQGPGGTDYFAGLIKTPEMPEASAFMPTTISDIKAANPAAEMHLIQPPSVSQTGEAQINYPLVVPEGRQGMTPNINLNYNSDAGTGWMGIGWNINVPAVRIDTRWGVPTFDATLESEVYSLNGESLTMEGGIKANRNPGNRPALDSVHFFTRTMHGYKKIIRYGTATTNYYWEEVSAGGTHFYYGTTDGNSLDTNAVLKDGSGNVLRWYLKRVEDKWGNNITYNYTTYHNNSSGNIKSGGKQRVLGNIRYTGHGTTAGNYEVVFETSGNRMDGRVMMNLGEKLLDDRQLDAVKVNYYDNGTPQEVKRFDFHYINGDFDVHPLLEKVVEYRDQKYFYKHTFDYYNGDLRFNYQQNLHAGDRNNMLFKDIPNSMDGHKQALFDGFKPSGINTTTTRGGSGGGGGGLGLALGSWPVPDKTFAFSFRLGWGNRYTRDKVSLEDMNGDGLPDLVYDRKNGGANYAPLRLSQAGYLDFKGENDIDYYADLLESNTSDFTYGFDFTLPLRVLYYGRNWKDSKTETSRYLTDYNADGIKDLVVPNGQSSSMVLFGEVSPSGKVSFNPSSEHTPNPVVKGQSPATIPIPQDTLKDLEIVRTWIAPYSGSVTISGSVELDYTTDDYVYAAIQKNSSYLTGMTAITDTVLPTDMSIINSFAVNKDDTLVFRLRSNQNGYGDLVHWNPEVTYTSGTNTDGNGTDYGQTDYEEAFLLSAYEGVQFLADRSFRINWPNFTVPQLSDKVTLRIRVRAEDTDDGSVIVDKVYDYVIPPSTQKTPLPSQFKEPGQSTAPAFMQSMTTIPDVDADPQYLGTVTFEVLSTSNVDWQDIDWRPEVEFGPECGEADAVKYPTVYYQTYNRVATMNAPHSTSSYSAGTDLVVWPAFNTSDFTEIFHDDELGGGHNYHAYMVVKGNTKVLQAVYLKIFENSVSYYELPTVFGDQPTTTLNLSQAATGHTFSSSVVTGTNLYVEFFAPNPRIGKMLADHAVPNIYDVVDGGTGEAIEISGFNVFFEQRSELQDYLLGWGQFCWSQLTAQAIPTAKMRSPYTSLAENNDYSSGEPPSIQDLENNEQLNSQNPMEQEFWLLQATRGEKELNEGSPIPTSMFEDRTTLDRWAFLGTYVGAYRYDGMTIPGKLAEPPREINTQPLPTPGTYGAIAYPQIQTSFTLSQTSGSAIRGAGVSYVPSETIEDAEKYHSKTISSFMDVNGDGYPDLLSGIVTDSLVITSTDPLGGHKDYHHVLDISQSGMTKSINVSQGSVASGTFINNDRRFTNIATLGTGISQSLGHTDSEAEWQDINGDGLPDRIHKLSKSALSLELNNGTGVAPGVTISNATTSHLLNYNEGVNDILFSIAGQEAWAGLSYTHGSNVQRLNSESEKTMVDINGDGLVDMLEKVGTNVQLYLNNGTSFNLYTSTGISDIPDLNRTEGLGVATTGGGTFAFPVLLFLFFNLKATVSGDGQGEFAVNKSTSTFKDMNGDGYPDMIRHDDDDGLLVYLSAIGKSNLLKKVTNPLKGSFTMNYKRVGNRYGLYDTEVHIHTTPENDRMVWDMPESKWVMDSLIVDDGLYMENSSRDDIDGWDDRAYSFAYDGGIKSRREREFLGFTRVETRHRPNREDVPPYSAQDHKRKFWISKVNDYFRPSNNDHSYRKRFEHMRGLSPSNYTLLCEEWRAPDGDGGPIVLFDTITLISQDKREYEFQEVSTDRTDNLNFNRVYKDGNDEFVAVNWNTVSETQTLFPAVIATEHIAAPDLTPWYDKQNIDQYLMNRYEYKYDNYFNVVEKVDEGLSADVSVQKVIVDTLFVEEYEYYEFEYTQADAINGNSPFTELLYTDPVSGDQCYLVTFEDFDADTVCLPSYFVNPPEEPCWDPDPSSGEGPTYTLVLRKLVRDTVLVEEEQHSTNFKAPIIAHMEYFLPDEAAGRTNALQDHKIYIGDIQNGLTRHAHMDNLTPNKKAVETMAHYADGSIKSLTEFTYDVYGNVTQLIGPPNHQNQQLTVSFTYDGEVKQFITGVSNSYGERICRNYDYTNGKKLKEVDVNGHAMGYHYDDFDRLIGVYGPKAFHNSGYAATIAFDYFPIGIDSAMAISGSEYRLGVPVAITSHNVNPRELANEPVSCWNGVEGNPANDCAAVCDFGSRPAILDPLKTATFMDGLKRVVQVKKEVPKDSAGVANVKQMLVSGITEYDRQGRDSTLSLQVEELISGSYPLGKLNTQKSSSYQVKSAYDYIGRLEKQDLIRESSGSYSEVLMDYTWTNLDGTDTYNILTNFEGQNVRSYHNSKGQEIASTQSGAGTTYFTFDPLDQLLKVIDPVGDSVKYQYDFMGRVTQEEHTDKGTTVFTYDKANNIRTIERAEIAPSTIQMNYNYNRLTQRTYPNSNGINQVRYTYGSRNDGKNGAGRVVQCIQGINFKVEYYKYDDLGNLVYEKKSLKTPQAKLRHFTTEFEYDSWGRIQWMKYPDEEEVNYVYGLSGELEGINPASMTPTPDNPIIDSIRYDGFENISRIRYGNGTQTNFTYDGYAKRLSTQQLDVTGGRLLDKTFTYNATNNVHTVVNTASGITVGSVKFGGEYDHTYTYDNANRLTQSISDYGDPDQNNNQNYLELNMTYNADGGINSKELINLDRQGSSLLYHNYDNDYTYQSAKPHQLDRTDPSHGLSHVKYQYNDEGSITQQTDYIGSQVFSKQNFRWNEEQRLEAVKNDNGVHHYVYDQNGERILKSTLRESGTAQNGQGTSSGTGLDPYIVYASPWFVATHYIEVVEASKHYYMGAQRVASALITYDYETQVDDSWPDPIGGGEPPEAVLLNLQDVLDHFELEEGEDYVLEEMDNSQSIEDYHSESYYNTAIENCDEQDEQCYCEISMYWAGQNGVECPEYRIMYWYHPDYLGHNEAITNQAGQPYQYFLHSPFGDNIVHDHSYQGSYSVPWRFNGKEYDQETGNYYYGARYYDPKLSIWLSVDPLAHMAPGWTPYRFCFNNPINVIDPDGLIEQPLKGRTAVNKKDTKNGGWGLKNTIIRTSTYREIRNVGTSPHIGIDYRASVGTAFYSLGDGTVSAIGETSGGAKYITVEYANGDNVRFLHISGTAEGLKVGSPVKEGQQLGLTGATGTKQPHLHVDATDKDGNRINPEGANYGSLTNQEFFDDYAWDYNSVPDNSQNSSGTSPVVGTSGSVSELSGPDWARSNKILSHIYFIFTGKDPGLTDQQNLR